jgi:hypothetical protein
MKNTMTLTRREFLATSGIVVAGIRPTGQQANQANRPTSQQANRPT